MGTHIRTEGGCPVAGCEGDVWAHHVGDHVVWKCSRNDMHQWLPDGKPRYTIRGIDELEVTK